MTKRKLFQWYCGTLALFLLFWWPLSHWFYPDWYHQLLGFERYDAAFVKLIGTMGVLPIVGLIWTAFRPEEGRAFGAAFILWLVCLGATYLYLIATQGFPKGELVNVGLIAGNLVVWYFLFSETGQSSVVEETE